MAKLNSVLSSGLEWPEHRRHTVRLLVHSPRMPASPPPGGHAGDWVNGVIKFLVGAAVPEDTRESIARRLREESLDPRVFLEECLLSEEFESDG